MLTSAFQNRQPIAWHTYFTAVFRFLFKQLPHHRACSSGQLVEEEEEEQPSLKVASSHIPPEILLLIFEHAISLDSDPQRRGASAVKNLMALAGTNRAFHKVYLLQKTRFMDRALQVDTHIHYLQALELASVELSPRSPEQTNLLRTKKQKVPQEPPLPSLSQLQSAHNLHREISHISSYLYDLHISNTARQGLSAHWHLVPFTPYWLAATYHFALYGSNPSTFKLDFSLPRTQAEKLEESWCDAEAREAFEGLVQTVKSEIGVVLGDVRRLGRGVEVGYYEVLEWLCGEGMWRQTVKALGWNLERTGEWWKEEGRVVGEEEWTSKRAENALGIFEEVGNSCREKMAAPKEGGTGEGKVAVVSTGAFWSLNGIRPFVKAY